MIDVFSEELLTPKQAAACLPGRGRGKPVHVATIHRWIQKGIRGVHLEAVRVGGVLYTNRRALQAFADRSTQRDFGAAASNGGRCGQSPRQARHIDAQLDAAGI